MNSNDVSLNLIAITIFAFVLASLVGPLVDLSPAIPATLAGGLLVLATVDTLGWQNRGSTLLVDAIAQFSPEHRDRILHHEAGHFLVAHTLDIPITGYSLNAWEAFRQGQPGNGGVRFNTQNLENSLNQGNLPATVVDRYCIVWMAGIAAELLTYNQAEGGMGDRQQIRTLYQLIRQSPDAAQQKERWAILQAKTLLQTNEAAYTALLDAMRDRKSVEECQHVLTAVNQASVSESVDAS
ncbi:ATP-dependent Zn protease [Vacuolonema iberomarrocanum]|uniref:ATP-dependent Zn protease n=1 Tax=Vacuolonema iberomarrocanum TaxID=3454632 RepID=UPI0019D84F87|nr:ATP-dependent Zn protease [filamentous cyanobacterium LEGE 07170]